MALSEKKKASNAKWDSENLKRMSLAVPIELYEQMRVYTQESGESINGFIKRAITRALAPGRMVPDGESPELLK